jgi:hypothetical protein
MVLDSADHDTWSVGSFFMNPRVATAPENAPHWPEADGSVKVSAAWLIEQAGFNKGFTLNGRAALSSKHTLAITNRGDATSADISELANHIVAGVKAKFDIELKPEAKVHQLNESTKELSIVCNHAIHSCRYPGSWRNKCEPTKAAPKSASNSQNFSNCFCSAVTLCFGIRIFNQPNGMF